MIGNITNNIFSVSQAEQKQNKGLNRGRAQSLILIHIFNDRTLDYHIAEQMSYLLFRE